MATKTEPAAGSSSAITGLDRLESGPAPAVAGTREKMPQ